MIMFPLRYNFREDSCFCVIICKNTAYSFALLTLILLSFSFHSISLIDKVSSSFLQVFSVLFLDTFPFHSDPFSAFYISKDFTGGIDRLLIGIKGLSPLR